MRAKSYAMHPCGAPSRLQVFYKALTGTLHLRKRVRHAEGHEDSASSNVHVDRHGARPSTQGTGRSSGDSEGGRGEFVQERTRTGGGFLPGAEGWRFRLGASPDGGAWNLLGRERCEGECAIRDANVAGTGRRSETRRWRSAGG